MLACNVLIREIQVACVSGLLSLAIVVKVIEAQTFPGMDATPIGATRVITIAIGEGYVTNTESVEAQITVLEVVRGEKAWDMVKEASPANMPAAPGHEYVVARIRFLLGAEGSQGNQATYGVRDEQFTSFSATGRQYRRASVTQPRPTLNGRLYSGESLEGWIAFLVAVDDQKPLMTFGNDHRRVWFRLY